MTKTEMGAGFHYNDEMQTTGYGVRSLSKFNNLVFIGCKDGSVTAFDVQSVTRKYWVYYPHADSTRPGSISAVRSILSIDKSTVLLGREDGIIESLTFIGTENNRNNFNRRVVYTEQEQGHDPITLMYKKKDGKILISTQKGKLLIGLYDKQTLNIINKIGNVPDLRCVIEFDKLLLISKSGELHWLKDVTSIPEQKKWKLLSDEPTFISDYASFEENSINRIMLSTDIGVICLKKDNNGKGNDPDFEKVNLPGLVRTCVAMTCFKANNTTYLWISDSAGDIHLFSYNREDGIDNTESWRRTGLLQQGNKAIKAMAFNIGEKNIVIQACRNNEVHFTTYEILQDNIETVDKEKEEKKFLHQMLAFHNIEIFEKKMKEFLKKDFLFEGIPYPKTQLFTNLIEVVADRQPELFVQTISNPSANLAINIIKNENPNFAIALWTQTFLGAIHRFIPVERRELCYLGVLRWLNLLRNVPENVPGIEIENSNDQIRESINDVLKWGLFGASYRDRISAELPLSILTKNTKNNNSDEQCSPTKIDLDKAVYQSLLLSRRYDKSAVFPENQAGSFYAYDKESIPRNNAQAEPHFRDIGSESAARASSVLALTDLFPGSSDKHKDSFLVAISWSKPKIEIFLLRKNGPNAGKPTEFRLTSIFDSDLNKNPSEETGQEPHYLRIEWASGISQSRIIELVKVRDNIIDLIFSPSPKRTSDALQNQHEIRCLRFRVNLNSQKNDPEDKIEPIELERMNYKKIPIKLPYQNNQEQSGESAYSSCIIGKAANDHAILLIGLRGYMGESRVMLLRYSNNDDLFIQPVQPKLVGSNDKIHENCSFPASYPQSNETIRNPVLCISSNNEGNQMRIYLGCSDGQIWRVDFKDDTANSNPINLDVISVAKMSAPVWSISTSSNQGVVRIFAGGSNGTLMAWQNISETQIPEFIPLWATLEDTAITAINPYNFSDNSEPGERSNGVMALTANGKMLLIHNPPRMPNLQELSDNGGGKRNDLKLKIPGVRIDRIDLPMTALEGCIIPHFDGQGKSSLTPHISQVLIAGDKGNVNVIRIFYPVSKAYRSEERKQLISRLLKIENEINKSRLPEALACASPHIHLLEIEKISPDNTVNVPWFLHELNLFRVEWSELKKQNWKLAELLANNKIDCLIQWLSRSLQRSRRLNDSMMFKAIIKHCLDLMNHELLDIARIIVTKKEENSTTESGEISQNAADTASFRCVTGYAEIYTEIIDAIDKECRAWAGSPDSLEDRIRTFMLKWLVDGESYTESIYAIRLKSKTTQKNCPDECVHKDKCMPISAGFLKILGRRAKVVRSHLELGRPRMVLEALRSVNLSLQFAAKYLGEKRNSEHGIEEKFTVPWINLQPIFAAVGEYLGRQSRAKEGLDDAIAHEICRTYALGICISPHLSFIIAYRLLEAQGRNNLSQRVKKQLNILEKQGIKIPEQFEIFSAIVSPVDPDQIQHIEINTVVDVINILTDDSNEKDKKVKIYGKALVAWKRWIGLIPITDTSESKNISEGHEESKRPGKDSLDNMKNLDKERGNQLLLENLIPYYSIASELLHLARNMRKEPGKIDFNPLVHDAPKCLSADNHIMRHSKRFWSKILEEFRVIYLKAYGNIKLTTNGKDIHPMHLLFSEKLEKWSYESLVFLEDLEVNYQIYEPSLSLYRKALEYVNNAAKEFKNSAVVQKYLVDRVLSHGLLERLNEHAFEFKEISHSLNPYEIADGQVKLQGASRFSEYVSRRAEHLENIPATLRVLQGLMSTSTENNSSLQVHSLIEEMHKLMGDWFTYENSCGSSIENLSLSNNRTSFFITLVIRELNMNWKIHGFYNNKTCRQKVTLKIDEEGFHYTFQGIESYDINRLVKFEQQDRHQDIHRISHGTGLYLARLAAAMIDWCLKIVPCNSESAENARVEVALTQERRALYEWSGKSSCCGDR